MNKEREYDLENEVKGLFILWVNANPVAKKQIEMEAGIRYSSAIYFKAVQRLVNLGKVNDAFNLMLKEVKNHELNAEFFSKDIMDRINIEGERVIENIFGDLLSAAI